MPKDGKTVYNEDETGDWVERISDAQDRSESYVMAELLSAARERADGAVPDDFEGFVDGVADSG